jgi:hydrogenase maturation protein HypF
MLIRRARGYAPAPISTDIPADILAVGGHLKASVALSGPSGTVLSQHIGDLDSAETADAYDRAVRDLLALSGPHPGEIARPRLVIHDLHPDYYSSRYAADLGIPSVAVQHHVAHIAAVIAEHRLELPVLGVAWDGTGYGPDGTIWGGEFIRMTPDGWTRVAHLSPFRLPGGDAAVREPRRSAAALLHAISGPFWTSMDDLAPVSSFSPAERNVLAAMLTNGVNAPISTSAGRLFDAVAALLGLIQTTTFEGQAAAALESIADDVGDHPAYRFDIRAPSDGHPLELDWRPAIAAVVADIRAGIRAPRIASAFHRGLSEAISEVVRRLGDGTVALSGGCFQNKRLSEAVIGRLAASGRAVHWPSAVPPNDGGLAIGQAWCHTRYGRRAS